MKRFFRFVMAAAVLFGAVACSQQSVEEIVEPQEVTSVLSVSLEGLNTRLAGDSGMIDKVAWGVYDAVSNHYLAPHSGIADFDGDKAEIEVTLFTGKAYDLVFFAYNSEAYKSDENDEDYAYSIDWNARNLNVNYGKLANLENRDAFYHFENDFTAGKSETFILKRPFAQLNVGQNEFDYKNMLNKEKAHIYKSSLKAKAFSTMNFTTGAVSNEVDVVVFTENYVLGIENDKSPATAIETLTVGGEEYKHIAMNYLLVADKYMVNQVDFEFFGTEGTKFERSYYNVPLQRNYRTNILGSIISDEAVFTVVIDPAFEEDENENLLPDNIVYHAFQHGGEVTLEGDLVLEVGHTLVAKANELNKPVVLNLNGHTIKNYAGNEYTDLIVVEEGATLIINGEGTVEAVSGNDGYAIIVDGTLIVNGGTYKAGVDENGEANAVLYARNNGEIYVNGGYFPNEHNSNYVLNKKDAHKATTVIEVSGGVFVGFDPSNSPSENPKENFVAENCIVLTEGNVYTVVSGAIINNADEFKAAAKNANLQYMVIAEDIDLGTAYTIINTNKVILGNNHKIKAGGVTTKNYGLGIEAPVNVEINDIKMNGGGGIYASKGANVTINNVELKVKYSASGRNMFYVNNATLTVNSGNFEVLNTGIKYLALQNNARAYVKGGTFEDLMAKGQEAVYTDGGAALEITGGKFQVATTNYAFNPEQWVPAGYKVERVGNYKEVSKE